MIRRVTTLFWIAMSLLIASFSPSMPVATTAPSVEFLFPWSKDNSPKYYTGGPHFTLNGAKKSAIDFGGQFQVIAIEGGVVSFIGVPNDRPNRGSGTFSGNVVVITHDNGIQAEYWHLASTNPDLTVGSRIPRGYPIGLSGCSGDGAKKNWDPNGKCILHLHLDFRQNGKTTQNNGWQHGDPVDVTTINLNGWSIQAATTGGRDGKGSYDGTMTRSGEALRTANTSWCGEKTAGCSSLRNDMMSDNAIPQEGKNQTVSGFVKRFDTSATVDGAEIIIQGNGVQQKLFTDPKGYYSFTGIPGGKYQLIASKSNVGSGSSEVEVPLKGQAQDIFLVSQRSLDIALIIDSSGSMTITDPADLRKAAAKLFVRALDANDRLAVVDFDDSVRTVWPLQQVGGARDQIGQAIDTIDSYGYTNISGGLQEAFNDLNDGSSRQKVAVLLTDGRQEGAPYDPQWQAAFKNKHWPIYTFGLSQDADKDLLQNIANTTGGAYQPLDNANQLTGFYNKLRSTITGAQPLLNQNITMQQGDVYTANVSVPPFARVATFVTTWPGSSVDMVLQAPDGTLITSDTINPLVSHVKENTFEIYQVQFPQSGDWQVSTYGAELAAGGEPVTLQADASLTIRQNFMPSTMLGFSSSSSSTATPVVPTAPPASPTNVPTSMPTDTPTSTPTNTPTPTPTPTPSPTPTTAPAPPAARLYVTNSKSNTVSIVDTASSAIVGTIPIGDGAQGIAAKVDGSRIYSADSAANQISVIDPTKQKVAATIPVGAGPVIPAVSSGNRLYVTNYISNSVTVINTSDNTVVTTLSDLQAGPWGVAVSPDKSYIAVTLYNTGKVVIYTTKDFKQVAEVSVGLAPEGVIYHPDGSKIYVANLESNAISIIDTNTYAVVDTVPVSRPAQFTFNADASKLYVASDDASASEIDVAARTVLRTFAVGSGPRDVEVVDKYLYVTNYNDNTVSVVNLESGIVTATIQGFNGPHSIVR